MSATGRRTRALLAACLVLFSAFAAGLHRWQHVIEHAADGGGCAHCCAVEGDDGSGAAATDAAVRHDHPCVDDCGLCAALAHGHFWRSGSIVEVADREPPVQSVLPCAGLSASIALRRLPPARGPPFLLG